MTTYDDPVQSHPEVCFKDFERMRQICISHHVINNKDVGFVRDMLLNQPPEFRAFILASAKLICEAGE